MASRRARFPFLASIISAALILGAPRAKAQTPDDAPRLADVPELEWYAGRWSEALAEFDAPGFAVAVVKDGFVVALDAFGVRNAAGDPATPDTCYYIASATKPFTAMAICMLASEGKLDLDAPVKTYLPQLELSDAELTRSLSLRDLLCHQPGIDCGPIVRRDAYTGQITDELYFRLLRDAEIAHQVSYSNVHYTLAARALESVSGMAWQQFLAKRLFAPAGMTRTSAYASELYGKGEHAEPMVLVNGHWERSPLVKTDRTMHAAGGIGTTARDAARWLLLNLERGQLAGTKLLSDAVAAEYYAQQSAFPQPSGRIRIEEGFALGWQIGKYRDASRPYYFHGGGYIGASSYFCFLPEERIGVALLSNCGQGGSGLASIVTIDLIDHLLGLEDQPDLLPRYLEDARQRRADAAANFERGINPAKAERGLSRPAADYAGRYAHASQGDLELRCEGGELKASSGDMPYELFSSGPDAFRACVVPANMESRGSFEVDERGRVVALLLDIDGVLQRFDRLDEQGRPIAPQATADIDRAPRK
jgi:CubicO group peptidase (beta-lactamase class C family)